MKKKVFDISLFKRLLRFIKPYKLVFFGTLLFVIGLALFGALRPYVLKIAVNDYVALKHYNGFVFYIAIMLGLLILEVICQLLFIYYASWLGQSVVKDIRVKLYKHILSFKMKYFDNSSVGVLITRTVTDMERIADIFGEGLFMIFSDVLKMAVVGAFMVWMNWKLSLIVFVTLPIMLFATKIFQKYMKYAFEEVRNEVSNLNSFVQERITGMKILQLFTREDTEYKNFQTINERHKKGWLKTVWYNSIFFAVAEVLGSLTLGAVIWAGGLMVIAGNSVTIGDLTAYIMYIPMMFRPLNQIANKFNTLQMGMVAADRVFKVMDTTSQIDDNGTLIASQFKGDIQFKDVHFSYVQDEEVLKGISFEVKSGQTIAIVGATGAGKSTIISLLNRFYDIQEGSICIDGVDIKDLTLTSLRAQIAVVLQDVFLFADTILNNITLNNPNISEIEVQ
ncbi:MAG TPA: ABC transporter ATP-binding protein, partial [Flavobacteriaceae bacterium]|nr:ABC transporter ATP-binding protein [Flavobacteriaceae bacterium]